MNNILFTVIYYNVDEVKNSEVVGIYKTKNEAVTSLIKAAHYEKRDGVLLQYKRPTEDFESYEELFDNVLKNNCLEDCDLYRIEEITMY